MNVRVAWLWLALIAATSVARAQPGLTWQSPASCPEAAEVRARIEQRTGMAIERAIHGVAVEITQEADGYVARIDLRGLTVANDVRELRSARCDELTDAVAIVLARIAAELAARPHPAPAPGVTAITDPLPEAPRHGPPRWQIGPRLLGLSGIGALPRVAVGGELAVHVGRDSAFAELGVADWLPSGAALRHEAPGRVDVGLTLGSARVGWAPIGLPVRTWIGIEGGELTGTGVALGRDDMDAGPWLAVTAGVGVTWRMAPWVRLVGQLELAAPMYRPRFVLYDGAEVFRPEWAAARTGFGLELSL
ncbi:MAG TPA: hypothetical protein VGC42_25965 [Kofleriaceae bacterium]